MTSHLKEIKEHIDHSMNQLRTIISDNRNDSKLKGIIFPGISDYRNDSKSHNPGKGKTFDLTQYGLGKTFYIGSHGVLLGTGFAKDVWPYKDWLKLMKHLDNWYRYFYDNHKDKFFVGDIRPPSEGDNKTKLIRIFGANTGNWNQKEGSQIYGGGQARVIGKQTKYVFGILTMNNFITSEETKKRNSLKYWKPFSSIGIETASSLFNGEDYEVPEEPLNLSRPIGDQFFNYWFESNKEKLDNDYSKLLWETKQLKKTGHWIWYIYPNIKGVNSVRGANVEISDINEYKILLSNDHYNRAKNLIDTKPLEWFGQADKGRVRSFRTNKIIQSFIKNFFDKL